MINGQSGGILPVLVFGAGTDYALLLVARYREELRRHDSQARGDAARAAHRRPGDLLLRPDGDAALLVLTLAEVNGTAGLGPIGAMGIFVAMLFMLTMLPGAAGRRAAGARSGRSCPTGRAGRSLPHAIVWRRVIFSVLVGGIAAGDRLRGRRRRSAAIGFVARRAAQLLRARAAVPPARPKDVLSADRAAAGRAPPAQRRDARLLAADRRARRRCAAARGGGHDARAAGPVAPGLLQLDTGLTSGNSFRGEVEAVRGLRPAVAHFPAGANVPTTVVDPGPRPTSSRCAPRCEAIRRSRRSASPCEGPPGAKVDVQLKVDPYSTEAFDADPGPAARGEARGRRGGAGRRRRPRPSTTCASRRRATTG